MSYKFVQFNAQKAESNQPCVLMYRMHQVGKRSKCTWYYIDEIEVLHKKYPNDIELFEALMHYKHYWKLTPYV